MKLSAVRQLFHRANQRKGEFARALQRDSKQSFWALADQGVVSLGNFGVNILLAKQFDAQNNLSSLGSFGILMELMLFLMGVQGALVVYPLTLRGAAADRRNLAHLTTMATALTFLTTPFFGAALILTCLVAKIDASIIPWVVAAMLAWQVQETFRRALIAHLRFRVATVGDSISYVGQVAAILLLAKIDRLTLANVFAVMAITSTLAAMLQAWQVGVRRIGVGETVAFVGECWRTGRWVLLGSFSGFLSGTLFTWNLAFWTSKELVGVYRAVTNLLRLANPLMFAISTLVLPQAAKAHVRQGIGAARRVFVRLATFGGVLLGPYLATLCFAPALSLAIFYGWGSEFERYTLALSICSIATALTYLTTVTSSFLNAVKQGRYAFYAQMVFAIAVVTVTMPLSAKFGVTGAAVGWLVAAALQAAVGLYYVLKISEDIRTRTLPGGDEERPPTVVVSAATATG